MLDIDPSDAGEGQLLAQLNQLLRIGILGNDREQDAEKDLPVAAIGALHHLEHAQVHAAKQCEDVTEGGVVIEFEPEPGAVDEEKITGQTDLDLPLRFEDRVGGGEDVVERLLRGGILDGIELEAAQRRVHMESSKPRPAWRRNASPEIRSGSLPEAGAPDSDSRITPAAPAVPG